MSADVIRRVTAEAIGTFLLVFMGWGAVVANFVNPEGSSGNLGVVFAFAFSSKSLSRRFSPSSSPVSPRTSDRPPAVLSVP
ncbi:MAG: hypothetical protein WKF81_11810 [Thermomicrobiales bacterium]